MASDKARQAKFAQEINDLCAFVTSGTYPTTYTENKKRKLRSLRSRFKLVDGVIWTREGKEVVTSEKQQQDIIKESHEGVSTGIHHGRDKTARKVFARFYWKGVWEDCMAFVKSCHKCQESDNKSKRPTVPCPSTPVSKVWMQTLTMQNHPRRRTAKLTLGGNIFLDLEDPKEDENAVEDVRVQRSSRTGEEKQSSGEDDAVAQDILHQLGTAFMSCKDEEEKSKGNSNHDEDAFLDEGDNDDDDDNNDDDDDDDDDSDVDNDDDDDDDDEWQPDKETCSKDEDDEDDVEVDSKCSEEGDDICSNKARRKKPPHKRIDSGEKPYKCQYCAKAFVGRSGLRKHEVVHRRDEFNKGCQLGKVLNNSDDSCNDNQNMHTGKKPLHLCHLCGKAFETLKGCRLHIQLHATKKLKVSPKICDYCGKAFSCPSDLEKHMRIHTGDKPFKCSVCGKAFANKGHCNEHERIHSGEKPYECQVCLKRFAWKKSWKNHQLSHKRIRLVRVKEIHLCQYCGKGWTYHCSLDKHIRRVHKREKPLKCPECEKCFAERGDLRKHLLTHSNEKPYQCSFCGRCFSRLGTCKKHELNRHITEKPKYNCQYCDRVYTLRNNLEIHEKKHFADKKRYVCQHCGKDYTSKFSLSRHQRTHTGEKPYQCQICNKSFIRKDYRDDHLKTHKT